MTPDIPTVLICFHSPENYVLLWTVVNLYLFSVVSLSADPLLSVKQTSAGFFTVPLRLPNLHTTLFCLLTLMYTSSYIKHKVISNVVSYWSNRNHDAAFTWCCHLWGLVSWASQQCCSQTQTVLCNPLQKMIMYYMHMSSCMLPFHFKHYILFRQYLNKNFPTEVCVVNFSLTQTIFT